MREMCREPEVPEARVPVVECLDGPARITSKELAPIHSVKSGILQYACSTSRRMDADLVKSALICTARLKNGLAKGPKKWGQKCLLIKYTTIGLRIPGYGAANAFIDFTEELKHTGKMHESRCTSR